MTNVVAVLSMLHEPAGANSATRTFRAAPVLRWTIDRLRRATSVGSVGIVCWDDQLAAVLPIVANGHADVLSRGPRRAIVELDRVTASRRWADGWRGGLHAACAFDDGFHAPSVMELADKFRADAVLLVPPASAMVDPALVDALIERAASNASVDLAFSAAAPGLAGAVVKRALLERLVTARTHPGRALHYTPERPVLDPVGSDGCVVVPASVARTTESFVIDSDRRTRRLTSAAHGLNGQLIATGSEELVRRLGAEPADCPLPRDVVLELNASRTTNPIYWAGRASPVAWPDLDSRVAARLFDDLRGADDFRLTLGGVGDPLRHPGAFDVIAAARAAGVRAVHVETDLAEADESVAARLAEADVDVVTVYLPAISPQTYAAVMGVDLMTRVMANLKAFVTARAARDRGTPVLVPTFVKLAANLVEMDAWYDQWLSAVGAAAIVGPGACGMPNLELADMSPATRRPCARLASRMTVLSDGTVVSCERDVLGRQPLGRVGEASITEIWSNRFAPLRADHAAGQWAKHPTCAGCKEWHRP